MGKLTKSKLTQTSYGENHQLICFPFFLMYSSISSDVTTLLVLQKFLLKQMLLNLSLKNNLMLLQTLPACL